MAHVLGLDGKVFTQTDGTGGTAGWNEVGNVRDLTLNQSLATADITTRSGNGYRQQVGTLNEANVSFQMVYDTTDTRFTEIETAFRNRTVIGVKILDGGSESSGTGLVADMLITNFTINQELENAFLVDVELVVAPNTTPTWQTGA